MLPSVLKFYIALVVCCVLVRINVDGDGSTQFCNLEMYGNDSAAYWACAIQFALQANWFPSPIAGLFSYQVWNGYDGFWQNGAVLETMANIIAYTNKTHMRYMNPIKASERPLYMLMEAYGPYPSYDDMAWYGLSFARIYEVIGADMFLQVSMDVYNWIWEVGWDQSGSCSGGFYFDDSRESKQTITNAQMLQLSGRLYRLTNNTDYFKKMEQIYTYISNNGIINATTYLVSDGLNYNCVPADIYGPTYNDGVVIGGLVEMYLATKNSSHRDLAAKIVHAIIEQMCDPNGIIVEYCEPYCGDDGLMYKGILVRNVRYLMDVLDDDIKREYFQSWLELQIESNIQYNMCDDDPIQNCNITFKDGPPYYNISGPVFSSDWRGPFKTGAPMQQTAALDLFISAIRPGTECSGQYCNYDPYYPPPQPLTCRSRPCPEGQDCCEYNPYTTYTCCATNQKCNQTTGICV